MSYINKALKKAQKEKDTHKHEYDGVLSAYQEKKSLFSSKPLLLSTLLVIIGLLAFTSYSWFAFKDHDNPVKKQVTDKKDKRPKISPALKKPAVKSTTKKPGPPIRGRDTLKKPVNIKGLYARAKAFHQRTRLRDAKRMYREVLKVDPNYVDALNNLGVLYLQEKNYKAAQTNFETAIRLMPENVDPYYNLACVYALKGETKPGIMHLKKACSLNKAAKNWARKDTDLKNLRQEPEFKKITKME